MLYLFHELGTEGALSIAKNTIRKILSVPRKSKQSYQRDHWEEITPDALRVEFTKSSVLINILPNIVDHFYMFDYFIDEFVRETGYNPLSLDERCL